MFLGSKEMLMREIVRCERMAEGYRANLIQVDDFESRGDRMNYEATRASFTENAERMSEAAARLKRFAQVW